MQCREEASKAAEADAVKARSMLRQERGDWERADAESRTALQGLREEGRMLQGTNAQLHADVTRLTKGLEVPSCSHTLIHQCMSVLLVSPNVSRYPLAPTPAV